MPTALICTESKNLTNEIEESLARFHGWDFYFSVVQYTEIKKNPAIDIHFIIYSKELNVNVLDELAHFRKNHPWTYIVYYHSSLHDRQFLELSALGIDSCVIGLNRKNYLRELLSNRWNQHWKRVPDHLYPNSQKTLSERGRQIINFIEKSPPNEFTLEKIAKFLSLSRSHLRAEFKNQFGINFRQFKQELFNHYETELLAANSFRPAEMYKILNYRYLGNYSRSFKKRHGTTWRTMLNSCSNKKTVK